MPTTLKRSSARSIQQREERLLDHFKLVRDIEDGAFAGPDKEPGLTDYVRSVESAGLRWRFMDGSGNVIVILRGEDAVAVMVQTPVEVVLAPIEH